MGALGACAAIFRLTRAYIFFYDEWDFVQGAGTWRPGDFFAPHNEHWSTVPRVAYWVLLHTVGASHYLPYMAVLMLLHAASAFMLFVLIRRRAGDLPALVGAALLLLLGRGWEDLLWAFQIGFYGSIAFGLLALLLLDRPHPSRRALAGAAFAMVLSLASSGVGLFFLAAVVVELAVDRDRRPALASMIPAVIAYATWYLAVGRGAASVERNPFTLSALASLRDYAPHGLGTAVAGLVALDDSWADAGLVMLAVVLIWLAARQRLSARVAGALAGLVVMFCLLSLVRGQYGVGQAGSSRYVLIAAVFLLLIGGEAAAILPMRVGGVAVVLLSGLVLVSNGHQLIDASHYRRDVLLATTGEVATVNAYRDAPGLRRDVLFDPVWLPQTTVGDLLTLESRFGDVVPPSSHPVEAVVKRILGG